MHKRVEYSPLLYPTVAAFISKRSSSKDLQKA